MHWELIKLRMQKNMSKKDMAELLGISPSAYSQKENGFSDFKYREIYLIAKFFNKRIEEIFFPKNIENTDILDKEAK